MFGWAFVWLAGTTAVAAYSVTRHAPAFEHTMLNDVRDAVTRVGGASVDVSVTDHAATLSGTVDDTAERAALIAAADDGLGIRRVVDRLVVRETTVLAGTGVVGETATTAAAPSSGDVGDGPAGGELTLPTAGSPAGNAPVAEASAVGGVDVDGSDDGDSDAGDSDADGLDAAGPGVADPGAGEPDAARPDASDPDTGKSAAAEPKVEVADPVVATDDEAMLDDMPPEGAFDAEEPYFEGEEPIDEGMAAGPPADMPAELPDDVPAADDPVENVATPSLRLELMDRTLTIKGTLADANDAAALVATAQESFELDYISNYLESDATLAEAEWLEPLTRLLPVSSELDEPVIDVSDGRVTLYGTVPEASVRASIVAAARERLDGYPLVQRIDVALADADVTDAADAADVPNVAEVVGPSSPGALRVALDTVMREPILFESDSATLTPGGRRLVDDIGEVLLAYPDIPVAIEGHTDGSGPREANLNLSQERANAVRDQLVSRSVPRERLTTYGYGEGVPVADNATPAGRAANRRIEFTF